MAEITEFTLNIFRFDPTVDTEPHYDAYTVPYRAGNDCSGSHL